MKLFEKFKRLYDKKISGKGLAIFRISYSIVLLCEVLQLFYFRHLIYDKVPYVVPGEIEMWPAIGLWIVVILFLFFGFYTQFITILNYILTVIIIGTMSSFEYHMFYTYLGINFLIIFLPISRNFSIDRLRLKLKYSNSQYCYIPPSDISVISHYVLVLFGIAFVYFDSIFFKLSSFLWLHGLGLWLPASMPQAIIFNFSDVLNLKYFIIGLGYLTLSFEAIFLFTFWRKKWRILLFIIGIGLHVGILIFFPIPFFAIGVVCIYLLMVPVKIWDNIFRRRANSNSKIQFYYIKKNLSLVKAMIIINHFDTNKNVSFSLLTDDSNIKERNELENSSYVANKIAIDNQGQYYSGFELLLKGLNYVWYLKPIIFIVRLPGVSTIAKNIYNYYEIVECIDDYHLTQKDLSPIFFKNLSKKYELKSKFAFCGILILCFFQLIVTYNSPFLIKVRKFANVENSKLIRYSEAASTIITKYTSTFFGLAHHGVFMDSHFDHYNHLIAVVYRGKNREQWLPITDSDGTPGYYLVGFNWVKWTFRVDAPQINRERLINGIRDFTAFWAYKNGVDLNDAEFDIRVKKNEVPKAWEMNFLNNQLSNPWLDAGKVLWINHTFRPQIKTIENM